MHAAIRRALQPGATCRLMSVDIPAHPTKKPYPIGPDPKTWAGPWRTVTDPEEIAQHVCAANARQYNQAQTSPFCSGPLFHYLGYCANAQGSKDLITGRLPPQEVLSGLFPETINICKTLASYSKTTPSPNK
jgi:hypothetical protein